MDGLASMVTEVLEAYRSKVTRDNPEKQQESSGLRAQKNRVYSERSDGEPKPAAIFKNMVIILPDRIEKDLRDCLQDLGAVVKSRSGAKLRSANWQQAMYEFTVVIRDEGEPILIDGEEGLKFPSISIEWIAACLREWARLDPTYFVLPKKVGIQNYHKEVEEPDPSSQPTKPKKAKREELETGDK